MTAFCPGKGQPRVSANGIRNVILVLQCRKCPIYIPITPHPKTAGSYGTVPLPMSLFNYLYRIVSSDDILVAYFRIYYIRMRGSPHGLSASSLR